MAKLINILLRKTDPDYPWGFSLGAVPPAIHSIQITWVDENSLAAEHLEPGDRVLEIEGMDTTMLSTSEVESLLTSPSSKLELLIMKKTKPAQCAKGAAANEEVTKTVKAKETVSSTREAISKTELLSEDLMKESKIITTEGTLHKEVMKTTDYSEEQETNTFWMSNTTTKPSKTDILANTDSMSNVFWSADSSKNLVRTQHSSEAENLRGAPTARTDAKPKQFSFGCNKQTQPVATKQENTTVEPVSSSSQTNPDVHGRATETKSSSKKEHKTDTFWTCPPSDLVKQETKKNVEEENSACRNTSGSRYISESQIFKSLNNYRDELRKIDPREEKRRFWESCRKGDSVRRFKWGDSIKPIRVSSTTASTECLYDRKDTQPIPVPKSERSRSCEPIENHSPSNPFSKSFNDFQYSSGVSPTNPFYNEFETLNKNCSSFTSDTQVSTSESNFHVTKEMSEMQMKTDKTSSSFQDNESFQFPTARSFSPNYEFIGDMKGSEQNFLNADYSSSREKEQTMSGYQEATTSKNGITYQDGAFRPTKAMSKEEFESKCKFFEKATSVPVSCVNTKAKGLVEERLKDPSPSPIMVNETAPNNTTPQQGLTAENLGDPKPIPTANFAYGEFHHPLMKPSDFINQQLKSKTSAEPATHVIVHKSETSDANKSSNENCHYDSSSKVNVESYCKGTSLNENKVASNGIETTQRVEPVYENLRCRSHTGTSTSNSSSTEQARNETHISNVAQDSNYAQQETRNHFQTSDTGLHCYESNFYPGNSSYVSSRASEIQASREERLRESLNKKIEWFIDGMKPHEALNDQVQCQSAGSSERDFYEKRTFKESSFEKVTRSSNSPYENVESASSREYQEELGPSKNFSSRSRTPAGFYDNATIDDFGKELRSKSPLDISLKSFQDIRNRLGSLLGGTPMNINCSSTKLQISRGGVDNVEEAFQKLAIQEGIVGSTSESGTKSDKSYNGPNE